MNKAIFSKVLKKKLYNLGNNYWVKLDTFGFDPHPLDAKACERSVVS